MDFFEFYRIYAFSNNDIRNQIEDFLAKFQTQSDSLEKDSDIAYKVQAPSASQ